MSQISALAQAVSRQSKAIVNDTEQAVKSDMKRMRANIQDCLNSEQATLERSIQQHGSELQNEIKSMSKLNKALIKTTLLPAIAITMVLVLLSYPLITWTKTKSMELYSLQMQVSELTRASKIRIEDGYIYTNSHDCRYENPTNKTIVCKLQ